MTTKIRALVASLLLVALSACSKPGIDAGENGGVAFIAMAGMLILTAIILWFFLGRQD